MKPRFSSHILPLLTLILIAGGSRIVLHNLGYANNIAPVTAIAIFLSCMRSPSEALWTTLGIRFVSDVVIGFFSWPLMIAVYLSHLFGITLGTWIKKKRTVGRIVAAPLISATVFFLVTNFAYFYSFYPHNWEGVIQSYVNALPFFRWTLIGDVGYTVLLFGGYEIYRAVMMKTPARAGM